jgi:GMP synthase (glutamine-hydrolysing)
MARKVLLIAHSTTRDNRVAALLQEKGCAVDWRCPMDGCALPDDWRNYAGAVVFGGPQSANDAPATAFLQREIEWIGAYVDAGQPFLGICLGAQLLARALGARVYRHHEGRLEVGYYPLQPTPQGRGLFPSDLTVYHWHREGFDVPEGAALLAVGGDFANQAFRYGRVAYGLQFHPEVTRAMVQRWTSSDGAAEDLAKPGAQPAEEQLAGCERFDPPLANWASSFLDHWLALAESAAIGEAQRGAA